MSNMFSFVGEIRPVKDTESFKGYEEKTFEKSGWCQKKIRWNMVCGDNSELVEVIGGGWSDTTKNVIYTFSAKTNNSKGEKMQVAWKDRFKPEIIERVANFKRYIVDLNLPGATKEATDSGDQAAIEVCQKKRHEFISELDFVEYLNKLVYSDKIKGLRFKVTGTVEYSYSQSKNQFYRNFIAQKIYRAADDAETSISGTLDLYFSEGMVDEDSYEETKKYVVNCYTQFYENNTFKQNIFCPIPLIICGEGDEKTEKKAKGFKKQFTKVQNDEVKKLGVNVDFISGAQRLEITEEMLTDEQRENLDFGLITMDDIRRELSNGIYGERIIETRITGLARGYSSGPEDTEYTIDNFALPTLNIKVEEEIEDNTDIDLFSDDDDIEI